MSSYVVQVGDSPMTVASRFTGDPMRVTELTKANPSRRSMKVGSSSLFRDPLRVGETLQLPNGWQYPRTGTSSGLSSGPSKAALDAGYQRVKKKIPPRGGGTGMMPYAPGVVANHVSATGYNSRLLAGLGHASGSGKACCAACAGASSSSSAPSVTAPVGLGDATSTTPTISPTMTALMVAVGAGVAGFAVAYAIHKYG